jgi:formamidopyrimidine-DNA glycosylase
MPELPEVETIRRQLAPLVEGRRLLSVEILDPRWSRPLAPAAAQDALQGRRVRRLERRGKYLLWHLDGEVHLAQHLRMTGSVLVDPKPEPKHTRVRIGLGPASRALRLAIVDPRRFGTGELLLGDAQLEAFLAARLGAEPLQPEFTPAYMRAVTRGRRAPIKALLLDQRLVAGVGNIYADEALFRAKVHPRRPAGRLTRAQHERLHGAIETALRAGIDARGATIEDFRHVDGVQGSFQHQFLVYGREGEPCVSCGETVTKMVVAGRGTYVCERCQPRPRRPRAATGRAATSRARAR